jgi:hypothetical protein
VPQNMPGAAGIRASNYLYNVAPKDGTVIGMVDQAVYLDQILGRPASTWTRPSSTGSAASSVTAPCCMRGRGPR